MGRLIETLFSICIILAVVVVLSRSPGQAADPLSAVSKKQAPLIFIILPVENVSVMYDKFLPLSEYLEKKLARKVILKVATDYQDAIEQVGTGIAQLAFLDPSSYCEAKHQYNIMPIAKVVLAGEPRYRSVLVAKKSSSINKIIDSKGKRLALGNKSSSSSSLIPAVMFKEVGISLKDFSVVDYLQEEDRIALSVLTGRHDIGGLSETVAMKYIKDGLKIIKVSESIPQFTVSSSPGLPEKDREAIKSALLSIEKTTDSSLIEAMKDVEGFAPAEDRDFDVVRVMIKNLNGNNYLRYGKNSMKVAILPLYSAITLFDRFDPLMRYLSRKTGFEFKLVIPKDFEDFFDMVKRGDVEYSYSNPYIYTQLADQGYLKAITNTIKPPTGDIFRGIIITHADSDMSTISDLKGKDVMIVSPRSAGGYLAQKLFLLENGIDVDKDLHLIDGKRQEQVILNVYRKKVDAGFVRESALRVLKEELDLSKIKVLATTPYIPNWPFASTRKAAPETTMVVQRSLLKLTDGDVLSAAQIDGFKAASDSDFNTIREWIRKHAAR